MPKIAQLEAAYFAASNSQLPRSGLTRKQRIKIQKSSILGKNGDPKYMRIRPIQPINAAVTHTKGNRNNHVVSDF